MKQLIVLAALAMVGCGGQPVLEPSAVKPPAKVAMMAPDPTREEPAPGVMSVSGPSGCVEMAAQPDVLMWTIANVPADARIEKGYGHDDRAGCDATIASWNPNLNVQRVSPTELSVQFPRDTFTCGRTQVDVSINGELVIGIVGRYARDCAPPPPSPPLPTPPPPPPPPLNPDCRGGVESVNLFEASSLAVAYITVRPGYRVELTLRSYIKPSGTFLPQYLFANSWTAFEAGTHGMTVSVPEAGGMQADLYCGIWPLENLTEANFAAYDAAVLQYVWRN